MEKKVSEVYSEVLDLYKDKSRFAQDYYQYDKDGKKCGWKKGYSFCALGAICHFTDGESNKAICCLQRVSEHLYGEGIQQINDSPEGYDKVIKALNFAKELWADKQPSDHQLGVAVKDLGFEKE